MQHLRDLKQETSLFVGILVFMSSRDFVLSVVEHEKKFYNLGVKFILSSIKYQSLMC